MEQNLKSNGTEKYTHISCTLPSPESLLQYQPEEVSQRLQELMPVQQRPQLESKLRSKPEPKLKSKPKPKLKSKQESARAPRPAVTKQRIKQIPNKQAQEPYLRQQRSKQVAPQAQETSALKEMGALALKIAVIVAIALSLFTFVYGLHYNADFSMYPALKDGDLVMYYRWNKNYHAQDLLLCAFQEKKQVRRVIATAGDTVDINEEGLVINGALQLERDIYRSTERFVEGVEFPLTIRENEVFVLGDAREGVTDSRIYGAVNIDDTFGMVIAILRRRNL